jgi:hypothetical protein
LFDLSCEFQRVIAAQPVPAVSRRSGAVHKGVVRRPVASGNRALPLRFRRLRQKEYRKRPLVDVGRFLDLRKAWIWVAALDGFKLFGLEPKLPGGGFDRIAGRLARPHEKIGLIGAARLAAMSKSPR